MSDVVISVEEARGCGYRKPAKDGVGVYLVGPSEGAPCGRLPCELHACPACGGGMKPSRGWNWIEPTKLFRNKQCVLMERLECVRCPLGLGMPEGRHGLIWVGEGHYGKPADFMAEARRMGVSRKIKAIPKGFELGKTVVYLAHRLTPLDEIDPETGELRRVPAIFSVFKPTGIDLVIADEEKVPERATKLAEQHGARIVKVVPKPREEPEPADVASQRSLPLVL